MATILNILALLSSVLLLNGESHADAIYVDSVPSGANVYAVEAGDLKGSVDFDNPVGITPLTLQASEYPEKSFLVLMDADKYVEKVKAIPDMAEWIAGLSDNYFGESDLDRHDFIFGTSQVIKINSKDRKKMLAIGPIIDMQWPTQKRICVPFIPNTVRYASFYPLMPQRGTFKLPSSASWANNLIQKGFSLKQVLEAQESLSRCGCFMSVVKDADSGDAITYGIFLNDKISGEMLTSTVPSSPF